MGILTSRRAPTKRLFEWIGLIAAEALLLSAGVVMWPQLGIFLPNLVLVGLTGLAAVARDRDDRSIYWGLLTWGTVGSVVCLSLFISLGTRVPPVWGAAAAFLVTALIADWRRDRLPGIPASLLVAALGALVHYLVLGLLFMMVSRH